MERRFLTFIKLAGRWFVHLPNYEDHIQDLEVVNNTDKFCEILDKFNQGMIKISISDESSENKFATREYILKRKEFFADGAIYTVNKINLEIWLRKVFKHILGEFPETIYIQI